MHVDGLHRSSTGGNAATRAAARISDARAHRCVLDHLGSNDEYYNEADRDIGAIVDRCRDDDHASTLNDHDDHDNDLAGAA